MSIQAKFNGKIQSIGKLIHLAVITHKRSWHDHYLQYLTTSKRYSSRHKYRDINRQQDWLIRLQINRNSYTQIRINRTRCWFDKTEHTTTSCIWTHTPITYSTTIQYNTIQFLCGIVWWNYFALSQETTEIGRPIERVKERKI